VIVWRKVFQKGMAPEEEWVNLERVVAADREGERVGTGSGLASVIFTWLKPAKLSLDPINGT